MIWDEINVILNLVPDATPYFSVKDDEIVKIISEEAGAYYSGQVIAYGQIYQNILDDEAIGRENNAVKCHIRNLCEKLFKAIPLNAISI